jgi:hypothetical protein
MKTKLFFAFIIVILLAFASDGFAQKKAKSDDPLFKQKIDEIKKEYKSIQSKQKSFKTSNKVFEDEGGGEGEEVTVMRQGNEVKLITKYSLADKIDGYSIYYKNNLPFFIIYEFEDFEASGKSSTKDVSRYYFENGKLIQFLQGTKKKNISPDSK